MTRDSRKPWLMATAVAFLALIAPALHSPAVRAAEATYQEVGWAQFPEGMKFGNMTAVAIDSKGTIYGFQRETPGKDPSKVLAFDSKGKFLRAWGETLFPQAHGLRTDHEGNVWTTDRTLHVVQKFTPDGKLLLTLGKKGVKGDNNSTDALNGPADVAIAPNGDIFVADGESTNTRVVKYAKDGKLIKFWGTKGSGPGQLDVPHSIVMDSKGRLYVANRANARVEVFDQDGKYLDQITNVGTPYGLAMSKDDNLYVTDGTAKNTLTVVNPKDKQILAHITGLHTTPHGVAVDAQGAVYVAETSGLQVRKYVKNKSKT